MQELLDQIVVSRSTRVSGAEKNGEWLVSSDRTSSQGRSVYIFSCISGVSARTVQLYYAYISAFCGWAVRDGYLATHIAQRHNATEPLPEDTGHKSGDQQAWSAADRQHLTTFVDQQASAAIENVSDNREAAIKACLDRALVYLLSYSGVRGAEVLHDRSDVRREGSQWQDIDLEDRWNIETVHEESDAKFGFKQYQVQRKQAIERYLQLVFLAWSLITFSERVEVAFWEDGGGLSVRLDHAQEVYHVEMLLNLFEEIDPSLPRAERRENMHEHVRDLLWSPVANSLFHYLK